MRKINVIKRDSSVVAFDGARIKTSLKRCFKACKIRYTNAVYEDVLKGIEEMYPEQENVSVEDIQDIVEVALMGNYPEAAKEYILYRKHKENVREWVETKEDFIRKYKGSSNTANATVDDNSNVASKNIGILNNEIHKEDNIQISRRMITNKLKELFPDFDSKQYIRDLESHIIYKNDESSFSGAIASYCLAMSMYPFINDGIKTIGGLSARPKNLDSFCGMFVNMIFAVASQFAGACLHKDQELLTVVDGFKKNIKAKELCDRFGYTNKFSNWQGDWEYTDISDKNVYVAEDNKLVKVNKIMRRKYNDKIYRITTHTGLHCSVSKDHVFKVLYRGRTMNLRAEELQLNDTLYVEPNYKYIIDKTSEDYKRGQFIGIVCGDGCVTSDTYVRIAVHKDQLFIRDFVEQYSKEHFNKGISWCLDKRNGGNVYQLDICSMDVVKKVRNMLTSAEVHNTFTKNVDITNESLDFQAGFLDGILVTDGSYSLGHGFSLSLVNEGLIDTVCNIVQNLGFVRPRKNIYNDKRTNRSTIYTTYLTHRVKRFLDLTLNKHTAYSEKQMNEKQLHKLGGCDVFYLGSSHGRSVKSYKNIASTSSKTEEYKYLHTDIIDSIELVDNDDMYVYEIETETHWYNCGGMITHNCAVPEALVYFDYYARKEWGDDYYLRKDTIVNPISRNPRTIQQDIHQRFQQIIYSINQPAAARGMQSAFVNFSYFDKPFFEGMFGEFKFPDGTAPHWDSVNWLQKDFMQWFNNERLRCVLTFPVESFAMVYQNGEFLDKENAEFVAQEYARGHSFFTYISDTVDSLSSCCRLKNKIQTKEFNFTNGNIGVMTGSKSVISHNLSRIIQDWAATVPEFKENGIPEHLTDEHYNSLCEHLGQILDRVYKYHIAYNELLWDMKDSHLLPVYDAGFIDLNKQYLTLGLNGLNQAAEFLGMKCNDNPDYMKFCQKIFGYIQKKNKEASAEKFNGHKLSFNTEQVPAESLAIKNYNWDKEDGSWVPDDTNLYASYIFKPNDPNIGIFEKIRLHGENYIGDYLDGGSAAHLNLEEHLSVEQYRAIIKYAADNKCSYFTFNIPMTECKHCGHIVNAPVDTCPVCGSEDIQYYTRIIGYLTAVPHWSAGRQEEFKTRVFHKELD